MPPRLVKVSASVTITRCLSREISACMHMLCVRSRRGRLKSPLRCEDTPTRVNFTRPPARQAIALTGSESAPRASVRGCRCPERRRCWQVKAGCRKRSQHRVNGGLEGRSKRPTGRASATPVRGARCPERRRCWEVKAGCRKRSQHRVNAGLKGRSERPTVRGIGNPGASRPSVNSVGRGCTLFSSGPQTRQNRRE